MASERRLHVAFTRKTTESPFVLYKVTSTFRPPAPFSTVHFNLAVLTEEGRRVAVRFNAHFVVPCSSPPFLGLQKLVKGLPELGKAKRDLVVADRKLFKKLQTLIRGLQKS